MNRDHLLDINNYLVKYENLMTNRFSSYSAETILTFKVTVTLTFDLVTQTNRDYLLVMSNLHMKYEDFVTKDFQDNQRKPF